MKKQCYQSGLEAIIITVELTGGNAKLHRKYKLQGKYWQISLKNLPSEQLYAMLCSKNLGRICIIKLVCCPAAFFFFFVSDPSSAAGCSVGGRMSRQHPFYPIPHRGNYTVSCEHQATERATQ